MHHVTFPEARHFLQMYCVPHVCLEQCLVFPPRSVEGTALPGRVIFGILASSVEECQVARCVVLHHACEEVICHIPTTAGLPLLHEALYNCQRSICCVQNVRRPHIYTWVRQ